MKIARRKFVAYLVSIIARVGVAIVSLLSFQNIAVATDYLCSKDKVTYWIKVEYEVAGQALPCSVFRWIVPRERELLWRATRDPSFCEAKADEVKQKLESYGWLCQAIGSSADQPTSRVTPSNEPVM